MQKRCDNSLQKMPPYANQVTLILKCKNKTIALYPQLLIWAFPGPSGLNWICGHYDLCKPQSLSISSVPQYNLSQILSSCLEFSDFSPSPLLPHWSKRQHPLSSVIHRSCCFLPPQPVLPGQPDCSVNAWIKVCHPNAQTFLHPISLGVKAEILMMA